MKTIIFTLTILIAFCATGLAGDFSIHNPSKKVTVVRVIGPTPCEKSIPSSGNATFGLNTGIYRLRIMFANDNDSGWLESRVFFMPESSPMTSYKVQLRLPDPNNPLPPQWHQIDKATFYEENKTDALAGLDSVAKLLQLVIMLDIGLQGDKNNFDVLMAAWKFRLDEDSQITNATKEIEGASNRDRAIRELKRLAEENALCRNEVERRLMQKTIWALIWFKDRAKEVEPILSKYTSHADKLVATTATMGVNSLRREALEQSSEKDK